MTTPLAAFMKHSVNTNSTIFSIMAEMVETMEKDARLKKEILFTVDAISMEISRKDKLCFDVLNADRHNGDFFKAMRAWKQFRSEVELALGELQKLINWTRYPDEWNETYELLRRRAALHDDEVERAERQQLWNVTV